LRLPAGRSAASWGVAPGTAPTRVSRAARREGGVTDPRRPGRVFPHALRAETSRVRPARIR